MKTDLFELVDAAINDRPLPEVEENEDACFVLFWHRKGIQLSQSTAKAGTFPVDLMLH